jgi:membrane protein required for beta-lactamase induction
MWSWIFGLQKLWLEVLFKFIILVLFIEINTRKIDPEAMKESLKAMEDETKNDNERPNQLARKNN